MIFAQSLKSCCNIKDGINVLVWMFANIFDAMKSKSFSKTKFDKTSNLAPNLYSTNF